MFFILGVGILLSFMNSCLIVVREYPGRGGYFPVKEFKRTISLERGGSLALKNTEGDVEIVGWERSEVDIYAQKMITLIEPEEFKIYSLERLLPQIKVDKFENFVLVKTKNNTPEQERGIVNYFLRVPRPLNLKEIIGTKGNIYISDLYGSLYVELEEGKIKVENYSGSINASLNKGSFQASLYDLRDEDEISVTVQEGDIMVYLQLEVNARIEASVPQGNMESEFDLKTSQEEEHILAQIGEDGAQLYLSTLRGNIYLRKIKPEE